MSADRGWSRRQRISQVRYLCFILSIYIICSFVCLFGGKPYRTAQGPEMEGQMILVVQSSIFQTSSIQS